MAKSQDEYSAYFRQVLHNLPCPAHHFFCHDDLFPTTWVYKLGADFTCINMYMVKA